RSISRTSAPLRAAATAAESPAEPPPTTRTSTVEVKETRELGRSKNCGAGPGVTDDYGHRLSGRGAPLTLAYPGLTGSLSVQERALSDDIQRVHLAEGVGKTLDGFDFA